MTRSARELGPGALEGNDFPRFSDAEYERRWSAVREFMAREDLSALLIHGSAGGHGGIQYLSGFLPKSPVWLLVLPGEPVMLLHFLNHVPMAKRMSVIEDIRCYWPSAAESIAGLITERGCASERIGVVGLSSTVPHAAYEHLRAALPGARFADVAAGYNAIRWIRSEEELDWFRASGALLDEACDLLAAELRPGMTEFDVEALLHSSFLPRGGGLSLGFIASTPMARPDRISPWQFMSGRRLEPGDAVITEISVNYWGYAAQIHRPFAIASEPTELYQELFEAATATFDAVCSVLRAGATSEDVLDAAGEVERRGFEIFDSMLHGETGKNPELGSWQTPHAVEPWTFRENQVMVVQPNPVTKDRTAGLQAGCAVRVGVDRAEPLHGWPLAFPVCSA
jgi:Xaa-Pro dipeptidase